MVRGPFINHSGEGGFPKYNFTYYVKVMIEAITICCPLFFDSRFPQRKRSLGDPAVKREVGINNLNEFEDVFYERPPIYSTDECILYVVGIVYLNSL